MLTFYQALSASKPTSFWSIILSFAKMFFFFWQSLQLEFFVIKGNCFIVFLIFEINFNKYQLSLIIEKCFFLTFFKTETFFFIYVIDCNLKFWCWNVWNVLQVLRHWIICFRLQSFIYCKVYYKNTLFELYMVFTLKLPPR